MKRTKTRIALALLTFIAPALSRADETISTSQTQNGLTFTVSPPGNLTVSGPSDPTLSLTGGATTSGIQTITVGLGDRNPGALSISSGAVLTTTGGIGFFNSLGAGTVTVSGTGSRWNDNGNIVLGNGGASTLNIQSGGSVSTHGVEVSNGGSSVNIINNVINVTGTNSKLSVSNGLEVGFFDSPGTLNIETGGVVTDGQATLGSQEGSSDTTGTGTATVSGTGSAWNNQGSLTVGYNGGNGALIIQAGGHVSGDDTYIGRLAGSSGTATVTGADSQWNSARLDVGGSNLGQGGTGSLTISNSGAVNVTDPTKVWGAGTLTLNGGSLTTGSLDRTLGTLNFNDGTLTVNNGAYKQADGALVISGNTSTAFPTLALSGSNTTTSGVDDLVVGNATRGALSITNGAVLSNPGDGSPINISGVATFKGEGAVGLNAGSLGIVTVDGAGSQWNSAYGAVVGFYGTGILNVQNGGVISGIEGTLGYQAGSTGTATVTGAGSQWNNSATVFVGLQGNGTLSIENGGLVFGTDTYLGYLRDSSGIATVTGTGSQWNSTSLDVGGGGVSGGTGSLTISNSGAVNVTGPTKLWNAGTLTLNGGSLTTGSLDISQGMLQFNNGTLKVSNGALTLPGGPLVISGSNPSDLPIGILDGPGTTTSGIQDIIIGIGSGTQGEARISSGAVVSNPGDGSPISFGNTTIFKGEAYLGLDSGSTGTATVKDVGSQWNNGSSVVVGHDGNGTLNIQGGGVVSDTEGEIGYNAGSTGTATVTGLGSVWNNSSTVFVGLRSSGQLNIQNGGVVSGTDTYLGYLPGSSGTATVSGAGSQWKSTSLDVGGGSNLGPGGTGSLTISNAGAVNVTNAMQIWPAGTVDASGGGTIHAASIHMLGGRLNVAGGATASPITIDGGTVTLSSGVLTSSIGVGATNSLLAGSNSTGTTSFAGNVFLAANVRVTSTPGGTVSFNTGTIVGPAGVTVGGGGTVILAGIDTYLGSTMVDPASTLLVNGSITSNVVVSQGAELGGSGRVGTISGGGLVAPGDPTILTATSVDPTSAGHTAFAFELTHSGSLTNLNEFGSTATVSNDLLRLAGATPFNLVSSPTTDNGLTSLNVVHIYLPGMSALSVGETFQGGFYADNLPGISGAQSLLSDTRNASFSYFTLDPDQSGATGTKFDGHYYLAATSQLTIQVGAINELANFGAGDVFGSIETFRVQAVPEPSSLILLAGGAAAMLAMRLRRRRNDG